MKARPAVIDSSVLIPLLNAGIANLLTNFYPKILIPPKVRDECKDQKQGRRKIRNLLNIKNGFEDCSESDQFVYDYLGSVRNIHEGERQVIAQAKSNKVQAGVVLMDESVGRRLCYDLGIEVNTLFDVKLKYREYGLNFKGR